MADKAKRYIDEGVAIYEEHVRPIDRAIARDQPAPQADDGPDFECEWRQTIFTDLEKGVYGDCYRTAVAYLLSMPPDHVPHFSYDGCDADTASARLRNYLRDHWRGIRYIRFLFPADFSIKEVLQQGDHVFDGLPYLVSGRSPRHPTQGHCVVAQGREFLHDPHHSDEYIDGPLAYIDGSPIGYVMECLVRGLQ